MFTPLIMFLMFLFFSVILALSSISSMLLWLSLEMNMLSFLPIMSSEGFISLENTMKYFLVQSIASIMFISSSLLIYFLVFSGLDMVLIMSMMIKLGMAPFHGWFLALMKFTSTKILFYLSTLQKLIPLIVCSKLNLSMSKFMIFMVLGGFIVFMVGVSTLKLKKILALSSINNLNWMMISNFINMKLMLFFVIIYMFLLGGVISSIMENKKMMFLQMANMNFLAKIYLIFSLMSLGGLPPLLGFFSKLLVLKTSMLSMVIMIFFIFSSLMILFYYMSFSFLLTSLLPNMLNTMNFSKPGKFIMSNDYNMKMYFSLFSLLQMSIIFNII